MILGQLREWVSVGLAVSLCGLPMIAGCSAPVLRSPVVAYRVFSESIPRDDRPRGTLSVSTHAGSLTIDATTAADVAVSVTGATSGRRPILREISGTQGEFEYGLATEGETESATDGAGGVPTRVALGSSIAWSNLLIVARSAHVVGIDLRLNRVSSVTLFAPQNVEMRLSSVTLGARDSTTGHGQMVGVDLHMSHDATLRLFVPKACTLVFRSRDRTVPGATFEGDGKWIVEGTGHGGRQVVIDTYDEEPCVAITRVD